MNPNISIILPTYNRAHIIKQAIDSVLSQTYSDFELIIVDDCSTDSTKELIDSYTDDRIRYVYSQQNLGAAGARNLGVSYAKAPYLAFQDSDTVWHPDKLSRQLQYLSEHPSVSLVAHSFWVMDKTTQLEPNQERLSNLSSHHIFTDLLMGPLVDTPTILMHTDVFHELNGFLDTLRSHEDYEFSLRVARNYEIGFLSEPLLHSYHTDIGVNANYHEILRTNFYILNLYKDTISTNSAIETAQLERLFYYTLLGNDGQYFFDELTTYVIATGHRDLYYNYEKLYNNIREQISANT